MPDLDEIIQHRLKGEKTANPKTETDEVDGTTKHMKAFKEVKDVADELSGAKELKQQVKESKEALQKTEAELAKEREERLDVQIKDLSTKIDSAIKEKGPSPEVARLMQELENTKNELLKSRFDYLDKEIKELRILKTSGASQEAISEQLKQIKAAAADLGYGPITATAMSPDLQVQLKKMDIDLQLQLAKMEDERQRRDHEWQLTLKKWEEEKGQKEREIAGKVAVEKEKIGLAGDFMKKIGTTFARATIDAGQEMAAGKVASQTIEAGVGEFGEIPCSCGGTVAIARDATRAICPNCSTTYQIQRIAKEPGIESQVEPESTD